ncbi:hypothetical protein [Nocardia sp. Marseille-Q1738]
MTLDSLSDPDHITALARVHGRLGDPCDMATAHAAAVAEHPDWPVLTLDTTQWQPGVEKLPWKVPLAEMREP